MPIKGRAHDGRSIVGSDVLTEIPSDADEGSGADGLLADIVLGLQRDERMRNAEVVVRYGHTTRVVIVRIRAEVPRVEPAHAQREVGLATRSRSTSQIGRA